jgi:hypothetical protein
MSEIRTKQINNEDFPALFCVADSASVKAQKKYLKLFILDVSLLVLGAVFSSISLSFDPYKLILLFLGGVSFIGSLIVTILIKSFQYEKTWYAGRAVAESVKTIAWRYMICAEPFVSSIESKKIDEMFISNLNGIISEKKHLLGEITEETNSQPQISQIMRDIRNKSIDERKIFYVNQRVLDQRKWYSKKASVNKKSEDRWFYGVMVFQLLAGISAFILVLYPNFVVNFTSIFSALAMAVLSWLQVKRHQEQSQSYNIAAQELASIESLSIHIKNEEDLSGFVADSENAISREHTLWIARRDQL